MQIMSSLRGSRPGISCRLRSPACTPPSLRSSTYLALSAKFDRRADVVNAASGQTLPVSRTMTRTLRGWNKERRSLQPLKAAVQEATKEETDGMSSADIKAALLDSFFGTERGLSASSEVRAEINELISQLEAANPTQSPTEAQELMNGNWKLVYTSNSELMGLLAASRLPFVEIGDITQRVDTYTSTVENKVQISVPLSRTSFSASASFEVRSPKRLQIKFDKGTIKTPELLSDIDLPSSISVMGQVIDLSQTKEALKPLNERLNGIISRVGNLISQQPDLQFPIRSDGAETWLLTTYLDEDTRVTRGDGGSVFILVKEVSLLPVPIYS